jgi:hypothetical protein
LDHVPPSTGIVAAAGLADDLNVIGGGQDGAQTVAEHRMVIGEDDPHGCHGWSNGRVASTVVP